MTSSAGSYVPVEPEGQAVPVFCRPGATNDASAGGRGASGASGGTGGTGGNGTAGGTGKSGSHG
ncbi:hypothetical protein [Mycobacterium pseudokansasii]|uniref:hypothetical protein n=1 Tax=Mycobacterium pseudokansasii TaxID=2341080 RepID=UPI001C3FE37A|nr:hypothetical protein [Mycobacterium pseudokansasii]